MVLSSAAIKYQMPDISDIDLLQDYSRNASEPAFAEVVRRHINLVYSTALRHAGIPAQAEEIAQAVFVILARKAATLRPGTVLEAWLYETTRLTSLSFQRGERRRQFREQEAYMQSTIKNMLTLPPGASSLRFSTKPLRDLAKKTGRPLCYVFLKRRICVKWRKP
jgi:DNA-directed RNA polymerase specialized sigma24 family protein